MSHFLSKPKSVHIPVVCVAGDGFSTWLKGAGEAVRSRLQLGGFTGKAGQCEILFKDDGGVDFILAAVSAPLKIYDLAAVVQFIQARLGADVLKSCSFTLVAEGFTSDDFEKAYTGWALGCYRYGRYKDFDKETPRLVWNKRVDQKRVLAMAEAVTLLRDLVNTPANDLGPAELAAAAEKLVAQHKAKLKITQGKKLKKEFPLVHMVGQAAAKGREPRLIEFIWGKKGQPALTLVGKGVCFDTGGLDLKPSAFMRFMKKDMGGAAHVLGLAHLIMSLGLPVQLRVIIPAVENSVAGESFRPGDVVKSRSGKTVENVDTDAEGRLILADALAYAAESAPDLIVDFATLTGSARAALGQDVPACFTNDAALEPVLREVSAKAEDLLWPMPLYADYADLFKSDVADTTNHAGGTPGDLIYSALFLQGFLGEKAPRWVHIDCFAWESQGRAGRAKGGKDTGLRGMFAVLEQLYGA